MHENWPATMHRELGAAGAAACPLPLRFLGVDGFPVEAEGMSGGLRTGLGLEGRAPQP